MVFKVRKRSINSQLMTGFLKIILLSILLSILTFGSLFWLWQNYNLLVSNQSNTSAMEHATISHYEWLEALQDSLQNGTPFTGSLDSEKCSFGLWNASMEGTESSNLEIDSALERAIGPHTVIHNVASEVLELVETDTEAAQALYNSEIVPQTQTVIEQLMIMGDAYGIISEATENTFMRILKVTAIIIAIFSIAITLFGILFARRTSKKVSQPIETVSAWAKKLSLGGDNLDFSKVEVGKNQLGEVNILIDAFEIMATSIKGNAEIVSRVADGDMGAFVNIRSAEDSLGKNLYRMVQSNDVLFHSIVEIAQTVAQGSKEISFVSKGLADSAATQVSSLQSLSETVSMAGAMISESNEKVIITEDITARILEIALKSNERMEELCASVNNIADASEQVSKVIKAIDDIAFQTNILALNAAVEAARAGEAGKGFAVVADEVRNLAIKSAAAAKESTLLIEDTISKSQEGKTNAESASVIFNSIIEEIERIRTLTSEIVISSKLQMGGVAEANKEIGIIGETAEKNAAISQESAASSENMNNNADILRKEMSKFTLRERYDDKPYIPIEKKNDLEYIRYATEAYNLTKQSGNYGNEYITNEHEK